MRQGIGRDKRNVAVYSVLGKLCLLNRFHFFSASIYDTANTSPASLSASGSITLAAIEDFFDLGRFFREGAQ